MKTAILITGHSRTYKNTASSLLKYCKVPNNSDVFLSMWSNDEDGGVVDLRDLRHTYDPVDIGVFSESEYKKSREEFHFLLDRKNDCFLVNPKANISACTNGKRQIDRLRCQWYLVKQGMKLMSSYGKYDVVLRVRFDVRFNSHVNLFGVDTQSSRCYIPIVPLSVVREYLSICGPESVIMNDHWCYGTWQSMTKYGLLFDDILPMYMKENVPISNAEEMFAHYMITRIGREHYISTIPYEIVRKETT